jgi:integral membrane protein (TIGR01906 family)
MVVISLRIVTNHWFVHWEYAKPAFPEDPYGLTQDQRVDLAVVCVDYLARSEDLALLADLRLPDGEPAFNDRELSHMDDVQVVFDGITTAGAVAAVVALVGSIGLWRLAGARHRVPAALVAGSLITVGLLVVLGVYMVLNWDQFFTNFHRIFFEGDSWLFLFSDTLIRLFPIKFWVDVAGAIVGILVVEAIIVGLIGWRWGLSAPH